MLRQGSAIQGLCLILDEGRLQMDASRAAAAALAGGVRLFQYRNKQGTRSAIYTASRRLARELHEQEAVFLVNDHADIAAAVGADGVHLGQDDLPPAAARKLLGPGRIIGVSTHTAEQALAAQAAGADYVGFGPLFDTATKDAGSAVGTVLLRSVRVRITIPIIGIGGIHRGTVRDVMEAGADGAAVISAVLSAADITSASRELIQAMQ